MTSLKNIQNQNVILESRINRDWIKAKKYNNVKWLLN